MAKPTKFNPLSATLGIAVVASALSVPVAQAAQTTNSNPFAASDVHVIQVADKSSEGNCSANKKSEASCSASKSKKSEGNCSASKKSEGSCSASKS